MILFIDACVRKNSRTRRIAEALLNKLHDETIHIRLADINWRLTDEAYLRKRDELIAARSFDDDMFALARHVETVCLLTKTGGVQSGSASVV